MEGSEIQALDEAGEDDWVRGLVARIELLGYYSKRALLLMARGWDFDDALLAAEEERVHNALELGKKIGKVKNRL